MTALWLACCMFCAALIELVLGGHSIIMPVFLLAAFYFTVIHGWRRPLPVLLVMAALLDLAFGRHLPVTAVLLFPVQILAIYWRRHGDCREALFQVIPGAMIGALAGAGYVLLVRLPGALLTSGFILDSVLIMVQCVVGSACLLPLVCIVLDRTGRSMAFPLYAKVRHS